LELKYTEEALRISLLRARFLSDIQLLWADAPPMGGAILIFLHPARLLGSHFAT
jgi:hypothetical protein